MRLPLAIWVRHQQEAFLQRQCADGIGVPTQYVGKELALLASLGMLEQLPREPGDNRVFYRHQRDHPLWSVIDAAATAVTEHDMARPTMSAKPSP